MPYKNPEDQKQYYQRNKDIIREKQSISCQCECGATVTSRHKQRHLRTIKHQQQLESLFTSESNQQS